MTWLGLPGAISTEQLSESPTNTPTNIATQPTITPGGLDPANNIPTLGKLQAGSTVYKTVVLIEGCELVLSNAPQASVRAALRDVSGGDWASATVLGGLFVDLHNSQSISPDEPFPQMAGCRIKVLDTDHTDVFGIFVNKRSSGATARITSTVTRSATTLNVANTSGFASSGTAYIGAEAFSYTGTTATTFTGVTRGKYSPFGTARTSQTWAPGSGGARYASYQRVATDVYHTQNNPIVSEVPRVWIGKRIGVWLHTWDETTQQLNTHENAQCVFSGRIGQISDDPDSMCTEIECDPVSKDIRETVIFRDQWAATIAVGMYIPAGRIFRANDWYAGVAKRTANELTVVSGAPASVNEMQAGYYSANEVCSIMSAWCASERAANRLYGNYVFSSPTSTNDGLRTVCSWQTDVGGLSGTLAYASFELPAEVSSLLGIVGNPGSSGQSRLWEFAKLGGTAHNNQGDKAPFQTLVFKAAGPGRFAQEFTEVTAYEIENERGTFFNQYSYLPGGVKGACDSTKPWGLFLVDEKVIVVGSFDTATHTLSNAWLAPFQLAGDNTSDASPGSGRRSDDPESGYVSIRQILMLEGPFRSILNMLMYSSGTSGYNHASYDLLPYGAGVGIPGEHLGDAWERSLSNLPGAESSIFVVIDEPTKFADIFRDDLRLRRAFIRWKDEHFEFAQWRTPLTANSIASLTESNKAAPAGTEDNHRIASIETDQWHYPVVKFDYERDFAVGRSGQYLKSIQVEDITSADEASSGRTLTLKLRNTYSAFRNTGAGVEELIKEYLPGMPLFSKPARMINRTIDLRYFETLAPGDIVTVTDGFARDPLTGARSISARAAFVTKVSYQLGGFTPSGSVNDMTGEVECFFLDVHRGSQYSPAADVDWEANYAGFSAGYRSSDKVLRCKPHQYSYVQQVSTVKGKTNVGEAVDASWFPVGSKVVVVERDPADPTSYTSWSDTVAAQSGNDITLTTGLGGWSATKRYRVIPADYSTSVTAQRSYVYQADDADERVQDLADSWQFTIDAEDYTFRPTNANTDKAELVPTLAYGDGKPMDVGMDRALVNTINQYIDYKSAHQVVSLCEATGTIIGVGGFLWTTQVFTPIFFGTEHLSSTVSRTLTVAPIYKLSALGVSGSVRVTLARVKPGRSPSLGDDFYGASGEYAEPAYFDDFAQTASWTVSSTSYATGADKTLTINVKDLFFGYAFLIIEAYNDALVLGLAKCAEGARTVA